jgi:hypothetical protein
MSLTVNFTLSDVRRRAPGWAARAVPQNRTASALAGVLACA